MIRHFSYMHSNVIKLICAWHVLDTRHIKEKNLKSIQQLCSPCPEEMVQVSSSMCVSASLNTQTLLG